MTVVISRVPISKYIGPWRQKSIFIFPQKGAVGAICPMANEDAIAVRHSQFFIGVVVGTVQYDSVSVFGFFVFLFSGPCSAFMVFRFTFCIFLVCCSTRAIFLSGAQFPRYCSRLCPRLRIAHAKGLFLIFFLEKLK